MVSEIPPSTSFANVEWLFKQSTYGGPNHVVDNVAELLAYLEKGFTREIFRVETVCQKKLKYNPVYSEVRQKTGQVRNICADCMAQYESEEREEKRQDKIVRTRKRYDNERDLPF